jgi:hypothetical protein
MPTPWKRLKESLLRDSRYSQIALTLRANTTMTWDEAVDLLLSYEMTLAPGTSSVTAPRALAGGVDASVTETVKKLQAEVKTLNRALSRSGQGKRDTCIHRRMLQVWGTAQETRLPEAGQRGKKGEGHPSTDVYFLQEDWSPRGHLLYQEARAAGETAEEGRGRRRL